jgi:hypothetical protein
MVEAMMALVLADALMQQEAQCNLFPRPVGQEATVINPLGKKLEGVGVGH